MCICKKLGFRVQPILNLGNSPLISYLLTLRIAIKILFYKLGLPSQIFFIICAFCKLSALMYFLKAFSVLWPLMAMIKVTGVPSKNSLVQNERRHVWATKNIPASN
jgi:hypothetical protein